MSSSSLNIIIHRLFWWRNFLLPHQLKKARMRKSEEIPQCYFHLTFSHSHLFCLVVSLPMPLNSMTQKILDKGHLPIAIS